MSPLGGWLQNRSYTHPPPAAEGQLYELKLGFGFISDRDRKWTLVSLLYFGQLTVLSLLESEANI